MDFGLCPQLISERTIRQLLEKIQLSRGEDRVRGRVRDKMNNASATTSYSATTTSPTTFVSPSSMKPTSSSIAMTSHKSGLGFCEFMELIATIATESPAMKDKVNFPTVFSKVQEVYLIILLFMSNHII